MDFFFSFHFHRTVPRPSNDNKRYNGKMIYGSKTVITIDLIKCMYKTSEFFNPMHNIP